MLKMPVLPEKDYNQCATYEKAIKHVGQGWHPLVKRAFELFEAAPYGVTVQQVKEKFGGLRIYFHTELGFKECEDLHEAIATLSEESYDTCELCGTQDWVDTKEKDSGEHTGYIQTLCEACRNPVAPAVPECFMEIDLQPGEHNAKEEARDV